MPFSYTLVFGPMVWSSLIHNCQLHCLIQPFTELWRGWEECRLWYHTDALVYMYTHESERHAWRIHVKSRLSCVLAPEVVMVDWCGLIDLQTLSLLHLSKDVHTNEKYWGVFSGFTIFVSDQTRQRTETKSLTHMGFLPTHQAFVLMFTEFIS